MNLECTLQSGRAKLVTISIKGFSRAEFSKYFGPVFCSDSANLDTDPVIFVSLHVRDDFETVPVSHCHLAHCYSGQAFACQAAMLCVYV